MGFLSFKRKPGGSLVGNALRAITGKSNNMPPTGSLFNMGKPGGINFPNMKGGSFQMPNSGIPATPTSTAPVGSIWDSIKDIAIDMGKGGLRGAKDAGIDSALKVPAIKKEVDSASMTYAKNWFADNVLLVLAGIIGGFFGIRYLVLLGNKNKTYSKQFKKRY